MGVRPAHAALLLTLACGTAEVAVGDSAERGDTGADSGDTGDSGDSGDTGDTGADTGETGDTGPDPDTLDADGDGYRPLDGDCDDALPHVYPGAPDYCDALDQDCDGEPIPDGSCSQVGDATAMWSWAIEGEEGRQGGVLEALGDVDGDGRGDVGFVAWYATTYAGPLLGGGVEAWPARRPPPAMAWAAQLNVWYGATAVRAGDVNGDGLDDVWSPSGANDNYSGGLFLFLGRPEGFGEGEVRQDLLADAWWSDQPELGYYYLNAGADLTGDGATDAVAVVATRTTNYLALLSDLDAAGGHSQFDGLPLVQVDSDVNLYDAFLHSDLDGDGFDEWVSIGRGEHGDWRTLTVVEGEDFVDGAAISTVGKESWYEDEGENWLVGHGVTPAPDIDGDGRADFPITLLRPDDQSLLVLAGGVPEGAFNDRVHVELVGDYPGAWHSTDDVDGDGTRDYAVNNCLAGSATLAPGGTLSYPDDLFGCVTHSGLPAAALDMTGDGLPERVLNDFYWYPEGSMYDYNRVLILEGFDIPWDDPSKW